LRKKNLRIFAKGSFVHGFHGLHGKYFGLCAKSVQTMKMALTNDAKKFAPFAQFA